MSRRLAAIAALVLLAASVALAVAVSVQEFPGSIAPLLCGLFAVGAGWWGLVRRGVARIAGLAAAAAALAGALAVVLLGGRFVEDALILAALVLALAAARRAFTAGVKLPDGAPPRRAVLFFNPKSGGGKAERFNLAEEARRRGIEAVELKRGDDLKSLARDAVAKGADALGAAGGDGTQAIVAAIAAEADLPFACIPAGTRNHFALDLGVDRDDVVGALDALVDGGERRVDLAEVNGRVFVNNVSLGVYAEAVQREGYRDAKIRTLLATVPELLGPAGEPLDLRWVSPDGTRHESGAAILVSNNGYRLRAVASGTRPRLDAGLLGVAVIEAPPGLANAAPRSPGSWQWTAPYFEIDSAGPVPAGIDGEAAVLDPPLRFRSLPGLLRVRVARSHPGASPSGRLPEHARDGARALLRIALGADPGRDRATPS